MSVWRVSVVQALRAHSCALAAASLPMSLVQFLVVEAMKVNVSLGVLLPWRKKGHHDRGIGRSLCRVTVLPVGLAGAGVSGQRAMHCSVAGTPEKVAKSV